MKSGGHGGSVNGQHQVNNANRTVSGNGRHLFDSLLVFVAYRYVYR